MSLAPDDSIRLEPGWLAQLRLGREPGRDGGWVVVAPELTTAAGDHVLGSPAGIGEFVIREGRRVDLLGGAAILKDWGPEVPDSLCVWAADACASTLGGSFAIHVDPYGSAQLFVESGLVTIAQDPRSRELACGPAEADVNGLMCFRQARPDTVRATAGTAWRWSTRGGVDRIDLDRDTELPDRLREAIQYNGEDLWGERHLGWYSLLAIPTWAILCLATDMWPCGNDTPSPAPSARVTLGP